jgi:hypothetical protein
MLANDITGAVSNLFGFSEEVVRPAIQHHAADHFQGHQFFRNQLGRVQMIERKLVRFLLRKKLDREIPLGKIARCLFFVHDRSPLLATPMLLTVSASHFTYRTASGALTQDEHHQ